MRPRLMAQNKSMIHTDSKKERAEEVKRITVPYPFALPILFDILRKAMGVMKDKDALRSQNLLSSIGS
jgi:hypothetical protein